MKFSSTSAATYLASEYVRSEFAKLHLKVIEEKLTGDVVFPQFVIKQLHEQGFGDCVEGNKVINMTPELRLALQAEPVRILYDISNMKVYVIRKTVQEICSKINIKEEKKFDYLQKVKQGNTMLVLDENRFIKYFRNGNHIVAAYFEKSPISNLYAMFNFDLDEGYENSDLDDMSARGKKLFMQLIMFLEFAPFETVLLKPSQKNGTRNAGKVINDTPQNLIIVDSAWNKVIVRTEGFTVSGESGIGFLALRACGAGRFDRKFVWIEPYEKKGYVRGLNKEKLLQQSQPTP